MSLDPENWTPLRQLGHQMLDDMFDHLQGLADNPLWRDPDEAKGRFISDTPLKPTQLSEVHAQFMRDVLPYNSGNKHSGFMGWVQGAGTPVGLLADMLTSGLNINAGGRNHMGMVVEQQISTWMRDLFDYPNTSNGLFLTGTSQANFVAIIAARTKALGQGVRKDGLEKGLVAYASAEVHGCVTHAMDIAGLGERSLRRIAINKDHQMDMAALEAAIKADLAQGLKPFMLIGSAGTVNVGAIDDLKALADLAQIYGLHFHIDGAFGALGVMSKRLKPLLSGIERSDSIAFDFHKWAHVPYDAGFVLVRDEALLKDSFASHAAYLTRAASGLAAGEWWACDYGPDLSRSLRALKTWFTLKTYGIDALGAHMESNCDLARQLGARIEAEPDLMLLAPIALNIVCFSYNHPLSDALNAAIIEALHEEGRVAPSLSVLKGKRIIRVSILNHRTEFADIDRLISSVLRLGKSLSASL